MAMLNDQSVNLLGNSTRLEFPGFLNLTVNRFCFHVRKHLHFGWLYHDIRWLVSRMLQLQPSFLTVKPHPHVLNPHFLLVNPYFLRPKLNCHCLNHHVWWLKPSKTIIFLWWNQQAPVLCLAASWAEERLVSGAADGTLRLFSLATRSEMEKWMGWSWVYSGIIVGL
jgi:WD40 repeat protein